MLRAFGELRDPVAAPLIEPYLLHADAPAFAHEALWTLCPSGLQARYKDWILRAVNPDFEWDKRLDVRVSALFGARECLRGDHKDPELARRIAEIVDRNDDPLLRTLDEHDKVSAARIAAGLAMGGDPADLALHDDDDALKNALVSQFSGRASRRLGTSMTSLAELAARLERFDVEPTQRQALDDAASRMEAAVREALSHAPGGEHDLPWVRSGELRDSIAHQADASRAVIGSDSMVARYQELGTRHDPPRPFLAPQAAALGPSVAEAIGAAVAQAIRATVAGS